MNVTSVDDVITAVVAALTAAVTYRVVDGPFTTRPKRLDTQWVSIGAEEPWVGEGTTSTNSATMSQQWYGLGQVALGEELTIPCIAAGKASTVAAARGLAKSAAQDVFNTLRTYPKPSDTYGARVSEITSMDSHPTAGGAVVVLKFHITVQARHT